MGMPGVPCKSREGFACTAESGYCHAEQHRVEAMNAPTELSHEEVLRVRLEVLRREHRDLDEAIAAMHDRGTGDELAMKRLKKRKLSLKDLIQRIEDELTPDIIA